MLRSTPSARGCRCVQRGHAVTAMLCAALWLAALALPARVYAAESPQPTHPATAPAPTPAPAPEPAPAEPPTEPPPAPAPEPFPAATPRAPFQPPAVVQEGPYYAADAGRAGLLFTVNRSLYGEAYSRWNADLRLEYARDLRRADGGLGHWLGLAAALRYREISLRGAFDERWFGPSRQTQFDALHLTYGGALAAGSALPFSEGGLGLCAWWPAADSGTRVIPEAAFRSVLWRWPRYRASLSAFRRGEAQDNPPYFTQVELYGRGAWNFRSEQGWIYDGGARWIFGLGPFEAAVGYRLYGLGRHFAQGPAISAAWFF
ncbi:MAG: hypothetical protein ACREJ2_19060 [Planctomycetota bacterium]